MTFIPRCKLITNCHLVMIDKTVYVDKGYIPSHYIVYT